MLTLEMSISSIPAEGDNCEGDDSCPILILFDYETTGLSIYADHITDVGAKVLNPPVPLSAQH